MSGPMQLMGGVFIPVKPPADADSAEVAEQSDGDFMRGMFAQAPAPKQQAVFIQQPAKPKAAPLTHKNVLKLAKQRLREVNSELRRMEALKEERGELERLIAAAEAKPVRAASPIVNIKR